MSESLQPLVSYTPPGPVAKSFLCSNAFVRGLRGPIGSGKSVACCMDIFNCARSQEPSDDGIRYTRFAVIRNTYPELKMTTIKTWHDWFPQHWGHWKGEGPPTHHIRQGDIDMEVLFVALDRPEDVKKLLSMELTMAWINEAREVPKAILDGLTGRVGRYPSQKSRPAHIPQNQWPTFYGVIMDTNPPDDEHWWFKLAEEGTPDNFEFFAQPGGMSPQAENREHLVTNYYENVMQGKSQDWVNVYVHGNYGYVQEGKPVYPEYNDAMHCREFEVTPGLPIYRGWDFGLTPACVFTQFLPNGQWRILDELVSDNMGADRFSDEVLAHTIRNYPGYTFEDIGDPAGEARSQADEKTCFSILQSKGIKIRGGDQDPHIRLESVKKPLNTLVMGEPALLLHPRCKSLRKGFIGGYHYRRIQAAGERYTEKPDKGIYSHIHDAAQYVATELFAASLRTRKVLYGERDNRGGTFNDLLQGEVYRRASQRPSEYI